MSSIHLVAHETAVGVAGLEERMTRRDQAKEHRALVAWLVPHSINMEENLKEFLRIIIQAPENGCSTQNATNFRPVALPLYCGYMAPVRLTSTYISRARQKSDPFHYSWKRKNRSCVSVFALLVLDCG